MTQPAQTPPALLPVQADNIPKPLKVLKRWSVWVAVWDPVKGKYGKRPYHPNGYAISTRKLDSWVTFEEAYAAYKRSPDQYAGLGFVMAPQDKIVGVDLDRCVDNGIPNPKASAILQRVSSYTELSPSGNGVRSFVFGELEYDWTNPEQGIEVYAGNTARFLTVTGQVLPDYSPSIANAAPSMLSELASTYARSKDNTRLIELEIPDLIDELALPDVSQLSISPQVLEFLNDGIYPAGNDRSLMLFTASVELHRAGLSSQEVLSVMYNSEHAWAAACDKRGQDQDRALLFLWVHQVQKGKAKADEGGGATTPDDFEDVSEQAAAADAKDIAKSAARFKPLRMDEYRGTMKPISWFIRGILPNADLATVYGPSGAGKSFIVIDMCAAIARGVPWFGAKTKQGSVAYVVAEGQGGFARRIQAYEEHNDVDMTEHPFFAIPDTPSLMSMADVKALCAAINAVGKFDLIVIDTLSRAIAGHDENDNAVMSLMGKHCQYIKKHTGAMVLLVGHTGKDVNKGMRGSSVTKGNVDAELEVARAGDARSVTITKVKDGQGEGVEYPFRLETVQLGEEIDDDGETFPITSCFVHRPAGGLGVAGGGGARGALRNSAPPKGAKERIVLAEALRATELAGSVPFETLIATCVELIAPPDPGVKDLRRRDVKRAMESLMASGRVVVAAGEVRVC